MKLYNLFRFVCYCLLIAAITGPKVWASAPAKDYYQLKIYHYKNQAQETRLEQYLEQAYVPAIHRAGIKNVGIFKPVTQQDTDRKIYVFTPFSSLDKLAGVEQRLQTDPKYLADGKDYIDAEYKNSPYS
ncbi:MAG TPA: hypothetical protein VF500_05170, partial [Mucilaginibacter sp.]